MAKKKTKKKSKSKSKRKLKPKVNLRVTRLDVPRKKLRAAVMKAVSEELAREAKAGGPERIDAHCKGSCHAKST